MVGQAIREIGKGIEKLLIIGLVCFILTVIFCGYFVYDKFIKSDKVKIESRTLIVPEIRLTTDGKKIDTLYIYQLKK